MSANVGDQGVRDPGARRHAILRAASEVFFESGFKGASIDAVIAKVGGSKRSIYSLFGSKEGLFAAIVTENADRAIGALGADALAGNDLRATLEGFGARLLAMLTSPLTVALYRAVVGECVRFPDLARSFYESGAARAVARLAEVLERHLRAGDIRVADARRAAEDFIGMIRGDLFFAVVLGARPEPDAHEVRTVAREVTDIFLYGVAAGGGERIRRDGQRARKSDKPVYAHSRRVSARRGRRR